MAECRPAELSLHRAVHVARGSVFEELATPLAAPGAYTAIICDHVLMADFIATGPAGTTNDAYPPLGRMATRPGCEASIICNAPHAFLGRYTCTTAYPCGAVTLAYSGPPE